MPDRLPHDHGFGSVSHVPVLDSEATVTLLARARDGDDSALNHLLERCLPPLRRWAHGRLPAYARDGQETADLIQDTVIAALRRLDRLEAPREGALQAYLRQVLHNRIVDLIRQHRRRPDGTDLPDDLTHLGPSPLEAAIGAENAERYEAALLRLRDEDREAIIARIELQYSYEELAVALEKPTANAARVAVTRALHRLAAEIQKITSL
jgi:RNA polymerase sigma-70 factor, ECF subfamily